MFWPRNSSRVHPRTLVLVSFTCWMIPWSFMTNNASKAEKRRYDWGWGCNTPIRMHEEKSWISYRHPKYHRWCCSTHLASPLKQADSFGEWHPWWSQHNVAGRHFVWALKFQVYTEMMIRPSCKLRLLVAFQSFSLFRCGHNLFTSTVRAICNETT